MKKIIAIFVAMLFVFAVASVSFATEQKKAEPAPAAAPAETKAAPAKVTQVTGEVTAVDAKAKTITVKGKKGDVVISVDDKMLAGVKAGDKVVAKYTTADGKNTAKSVKKAKEKNTEPAKPSEPEKKY